MKMQRPSGEDDPSAGIELTRHIKRKFPMTRVIIATAYGAIADSKKAMRIGCFDYVEKENTGELAKSVLWALDLSGGRDELIERLILEDWDILEADIDEQGLSLENLCSSIFSTIPGWFVQQRLRTRIDEIDLKVRNESPDEFWRNFGPFILVECKNWRKRKPGRDALDSLLGKIRRARIGRPSLGFFVSVNGTPDTFSAALDHARNEDILVALIDREALLLLVRGEAPGESLGARRGQILKSLVANS
jgi:CheY-like chemotaxis protein